VLFVAAVKISVPGAAREHATVLGAVNDAARRLRRWPRIKSGAIIDRACARRPAIWQVGTKGWP
jgi:hypothetical protein